MDIRDWSVPVPQAPVVGTDSSSALSHSLPQSQPTQSNHMLHLPVMEKQLRKFIPRDWEEQKTELSQLFHHPVSQIRKLMIEKHGLEATESQYKGWFKKWEWKKNITKKEWNALLRKQNERGRIGKTSTIKVRKQAVSQAKIDRYVHEHPELLFDDDACMETKMDLDTINRTAATPRDVEVYTPSNFGPFSPLTSLSPQNGVYATINSHYGQREDKIVDLDPMDMDAEESLYLASPAPISAPTTPQINGLDMFTRDSSMIPQSPPPPPSPTLSISSIIRDSSMFRGHSPAPMIESLGFPQGYFDPINLFQNHNEGSHVNPMSSSQEPDKWQLQRHPLASRYLQKEEQALWGEIDLSTTEFGELHPGTEDALLRLSELLHDQGRYKLAEEIIRKVLSTYPEEDGDNDHKFLVLGHLAIILSAQGFHGKAEKLYRRVIHSQKRHLGCKHPITLNSMGNLAVTLSELGRYKEAEELGKKVIRIETRVFGKDHFKVLASISNLAAIYNVKELCDEAEKLQVRLLKKYSKRWGEEDPRTLVCMSNLADTNYKLGRMKKAEGLEIQALGIGRRVLGEEHPWTLTSMHNLAFMWKKQGRDVEATELMTSCVVLRTKVLGAEHPGTKNSTCCLELWNQEDYDFEGGGRDEVEEEDGIEEEDENEEDESEEDESEDDESEEDESEEENEYESEEDNKSEEEHEYESEEKDKTEEVDEHAMQDDEF